MLKSIMHEIGIFGLPFKAIIIVICFLCVSRQYTLAIVLIRLLFECFWQIAIDYSNSDIIISIPGVVFACRSGLSVICLMNLDTAL